MDGVWIGWFGGVGKLVVTCVECGAYFHIINTPHYSAFTQTHG